MTSALRQKGQMRGDCIKGSNQDLLSGAKKPLRREHRGLVNQVRIPGWIQASDMCLKFF